MVRYLILPFALVIDALDILLEMSMTALGAIGGGAVLGGVAGAAVCSKIGITATSACVATGAALGGVLGFFADETGLGEAAGFVLGYLLTVMVTFSFGVLLIALLAFATGGRMRWGYALGMFLLKIFPVFDMAPGWTYFTFKVTSPKNLAEKTPAANDNAVREEPENNNVPQFYDIKQAA